MGLKALNRLITGAPDYETGSWTPTLGVMSGTDGSHTYSTQVGRYIKIGNLVWAEAHINISALDGTMNGAAAIKGLPFVKSGVSALNGMCVVGSHGGVNYDAGYTVVMGRMGNNDDKVEIVEMGDNSSTGSIAHTQLSNPHFMAIAVYSTGLS